MAGKTKPRKTKHLQRRKNKMSKMHRKKTNKNRQTRKKQRGGFHRADATRRALSPDRTFQGERSASAKPRNIEHLKKARIDIVLTGEKIDLLNEGMRLATEECNERIRHIQSNLDAQMTKRGYAGMTLNKQQRRSAPQGPVRHIKTGDHSASLSHNKKAAGVSGSRHTRLTSQERRGILASGGPFRGQSVTPSVTDI